MPRLRGYYAALLEREAFRLAVFEAEAEHQQLLGGGDSEAIAAEIARLPASYDDLRRDLS